MGQESLLAAEDNPPPRPVCLARRFMFVVPLGAVTRDGGAADQ